MNEAADELVARVSERARTNLFWRTLGVEVLGAGEGWARLRIPVREELCNAPGAPLHGGVLSTLVDMAVGGALSTLHDASAGGVGQATTDLNVTFLRAVREGGAVAEGRILHRGGTVAFGEAEIRDDAGALLAKGRATYLVLRPRA